MQITPKGVWEQSDKPLTINFNFSQQFEAMDVWTINNTASVPKTYIYNKNSSLNSSDTFGSYYFSNVTQSLDLEFTS